LVRDWASLSLAFQPWRKIDLSEMGSDLRRGTRPVTMPPNIDRDSPAKQD